MALPFEPGKAFIRTPDKYPHDAFGVDTGGRTIPHSGIDVTPLVKGSTSERILSVNGGRVEEVGFDKESGYYVIIAEKDGYFWGYGHNSKNIVKKGDVVGPGEPIALFGATGGAKGVHCHIWVGKTLAAALRIVHGYTNYKAGRTIKAWADSMGLVDPLPLVTKSLATAPATPTGGLTVSEAQDIRNDIASLRTHLNNLLTPGGTGAFSFDAAILSELRALVGEAKKTDADIDTILAVVQASRKGDIHPDGYTYDAATLGLVQKVLDAVYALDNNVTSGDADVDVDALAESITTRLGPAVATELAKRLGNG